MIAGLSWVIFATMFIAPRMLPGAWFERGITEYGMQTGVTALGLLLLRVADPQFETEAAESFGLNQIINEPMKGGGFITAAAPVLIVNFGVGMSFTVAVVSIVVALSVAYFSGWIHRFNPESGGG
jgi:ESS family glutamate:Na+ symporter